MILIQHSNLEQKRLFNRLYRWRYYPSGYGEPHGENADLIEDYQWHSHHDLGQYVRAGYQGRDHKDDHIHMAAVFFKDLHGHKPRPGQDRHDQGKLEHQAENEGRKHGEINEIRDSPVIDHSYANGAGYQIIEHEGQHE